MQSEDPSVCPSDPVESVTVRLGQLEITRSVRRLSPASGSSSFAPTPLPLGFSAQQAPASTAASSAGASWDRIEATWHSEALVQSALAARSAASFA